MEFWTYYRILRKRRWWIIGTALAVALVAALMERPQAQHFEATATLTTAPPEDQRISDFVAGTRRDLSAEQQRALAVDLLQSLTVAERVIRALGLPMTPVQLLASIQVRRDPGSYLIRLTASAPTEQEAVRLANAVAETAAAFHREINRRGVTLAREFIEKQVADVGASLNRAEEELLRFRRYRDFFIPVSMKVNAVGALEGEIARIDITLQEIDTRLAILPPTPPISTPTPVPEASPSPPEVPLRATGILNLGETRLAILESGDQVHFARVGDVIEGFRVVGMDAQTIRIRRGEFQHVFRVDEIPTAQAKPTPPPAKPKQLTPPPPPPVQPEQIARLREDLQTQRLVLIARREALQRAARAARAELPLLARYELNESRLERSVAILRRQHENLLQRLAEIRIREQEFQTGGTLTVVDLARMARRTSPLGNRPMRAVGGAFLGLIGAVGLVLFSEQIDNRLKTPEQAERLLGVPAHGAIPRHNPPFVEGYRMLRMSLMGGNGSERPRVIVVTSPRPRSGTSTVVCHLARTCSETGERTIVVDAGLRRPAQHRLFGVFNERGVAEVLAGQVSLDDVLVPVNANLWLLPSGASPRDPGPLFKPAKVARLLEDLRSRADVILIDTPAAGAFADVYTIGPFADGVLLVLEAGRPPRGIEEQVRIQLHRVGAKVLGVVVNKAQPDLVDSYYHYDRFFQPPKNQRPLRSAAVVAGIVALGVFALLVVVAGREGIIKFFVEVPFVQRAWAALGTWIGRP